MLGFVSHKHDALPPPPPLLPPMLNALLLNIGPAAPPQSVQTMVRSSTEIIVTWGSVPEIDENGNITTFEVWVEPLTFTEILTTAYVNTTDLSTATFVIGLQECVEYNVCVRAYTNIGPGPCSD